MTTPTMSTKITTPKILGIDDGVLAASAELKKLELNHLEYTRHIYLYGFGLVSIHRADCIKVLEASCFYKNYGYLFKLEKRWQDNKYKERAGIEARFVSDEMPKFLKSFGLSNLSGFEGFSEIDEQTAEFVAMMQKNYLEEGSKMVVHQIHDFYNKYGALLQARKFLGAPVHAISSSVNAVANLVLLGYVRRKTHERYDHMALQYTGWGILDELLGQSYDLFFDSKKSNKSDNKNNDSNDGLDNNADSAASNALENVFDDQQLLEHYENCRFIVTSTKERLERLYWTESELDEWLGLIHRNDDIVTKLFNCSKEFVLLAAEPKYKHFSDFSEMRKTPE